jgi:opacity protein-like surface antigen
MDFISSDPYYKHDTRTVNAWGGGVQYRIVPHVWAKADYEYQFWSTLLNGTPDPQGFTFGVMYDFSRGFSFAH